MESGVRVERGAWSGEWSGVEWSVENKAWIVWRVESRVESGERIGVKFGEWRVEREEWRLGRRVGRKAERKVLGWGRGEWREESRMSRGKTKLEWKVKSRVESGGNCGEWSSEENGAWSAERGVWTRQRRVGSGLFSKVAFGDGCLPSVGILSSRSRSNGLQKPCEVKDLSAWWSWHFGRRMDILASAKCGICKCKSISFSCTVSNYCYTSAPETVSDAPISCHSHIPKSFFVSMSCSKHLQPKSIGGPQVAHAAMFLPFWSADGPGCVHVRCKPVGRSYHDTYRVFRGAKGGCQLCPTKLRVTHQDITMDAA